MLSKIIVASYSVFLEVAIWLTLLAGLIGGWVSSGFFAGILGLIGAFIFSVVVYGGFLVIVDIQRTVRAIEAKKSAGN
jgi:hypothetical protein